MGKKLFFVLVVMLLGISGCMKQGFDASGRAVFNHRLGAVPIARNLTSIGEQVSGEVELYVTPEGKIQVVGGKGTSERISVTVERDDLIVFLDKAIAWGKTAKKERVSLDKRMGRLSCDLGIGAFSSLAFTFASVDGGQLSGLKIRFFYYASGFSSAATEREINVLVLNSGVEQMRALLLNSENVLEKTKKNSEKEALFQ
ncbi:hypothetical protein [Halodesulfovibrio sp. MK-HDV]|uniref:hypothetical protein n=1 Tax=Halodesulfovibrio sp. MK-HDV TaxID=2599925 RepID=UPI0013722D3D|nr:hypothetical protein [Halodesulfovibrio sp. MK-HDV]KAF1074403.1 hypothetical protein MKHDV_02748 [Halodesulfovibrio sp. MK-HDV]